MNKVDVAELNIDSVSKQELLSKISEQMKSGQKTWITTLYSEFLFAALQDRKILEMLNQADIAVADGIGMFWARRYLLLPLTAKSYWGKIVQALWQLTYSLAAIIFNPNWIKSALPEKIVGADLVWDLVKMAHDNNLSMFLLGGFGNTPEIVKEKIISKYPNIQISTSNKNPDDVSVIDEINKASPDILLVAYGPIRQEKWINEHKDELSCKLFIGLGGTFDYIAGVHKPPPRQIRSVGLEWLWRLFTQPHRVKRIGNATFGLVKQLVKYKVQGLKYLA